MKLSKEEFEAWKELAVTEAVMEFAARRVQGKKDDWAEAHFVGETAEQTAMKNSAAIGYCNGMQDVMELTFDQLETELADE